MNELRPSSLDSFVGQKQTVECLKILINSSQHLPHLLFEGPPGLGKTSLAYALSKDSGVELQIANGGAVRTIKCLLPYLMKITENSILFIDEIHRMGNLASEFLYPVMEDFRVDVGKENDTVTIDLPPFSLIGATTEAGLLITPLRDRFDQKFQLKIYSLSELVELITNNSSTIGVTIDPPACLSLAKRCRGVPRLANHLLCWTKRYANSKGVNHIDSTMIDSAMDLIGIDQIGLDDNDRKYLQVLRKFNQPVGIKTLTSMTNLSTETIEQVIEPFLLQHHIIRKTPKGRILV